MDAATGLVLGNPWRALAGLLTWPCHGLPIPVLACEPGPSAEKSR